MFCFALPDHHKLLFMDLPNTLKQQQTVLAKDWVVSDYFYTVYIQNVTGIAFQKPWPVADQNGRCPDSFCQLKTLVQLCTSCTQNIDLALS